MTIPLTSNISSSLYKFRSLEDSDRTSVLGTENCRLGDTSPISGSDPGVRSRFWRGVPDRSMKKGTKTKK